MWPRPMPRAGARASRQWRFTATVPRHTALNTSMDAKKEPFGLDAGGLTVLAHVAAGQHAAEADLKALEAKMGEKVEVSAKQVIAEPHRSRDALKGIARASATPVLAVSTPMSLYGRRQRFGAESEWTAESRAPSPAGGARVDHAISSPLPDTRANITVGLYPTGQPGESSSGWPRRARPSPA